jgi:hypothetical protein
MAVEPLSDSTRTAKRNLLVTGVLAVTYRAFDVTIDKLPFAGIVIDFNKGIFAFILTVVLGYFLLSFCVYYFADIRNIEPPPHQSKTQDNYWTGVEDRVQRFIQIAYNRASRALEESDLRVLYTERMAELLRKLSRVPRAEHDVLIRQYGLEALFELHLRNQMNSIVQHPARAEEFERINSVLAQLLAEFQTFERADIFTAKSRVAGVNSIYGFRNYVLDGALPITLGVAGLLAMYQVLPLEWVKHIAPAQ